MQDGDEMPGNDGENYCCLYQRQKIGQKHECVTAHGGEHLSDTERAEPERRLHGHPAPQKMGIRLSRCCDRVNAERNVKCIFKYDGQ